MKRTKRFLGIQRGAWWKYPRYEIKDGCICPVPGAVPQQYDPWESYQNVVDKYENQPPYQTLLTLYEYLKTQTYPTNKGIGLRPDGEKKLFEWCADHGLLGILLQRVQMVVLPWEQGESGPLPNIYLKTSSGWHPSFTVKWRSPGVLIQDIGRQEQRWEPLNQTWGRFFPNIPKKKLNNYRYPMPLTEDFWRLYAEPIEVFLETISTLAYTIRLLTKRKTRNEIIYGRYSLNSMIASVSPVLSLEYDNYIQQWVAPSLLSSFAMMYLQDISGGRSVLYCEGCGKIYITDAYQGRYCSSTCRNRIQKRRYRSKKIK